MRLRHRQAWIRLSACFFVSIRVISDMAKSAASVRIYSRLHSSNIRLHGYNGQVVKTQAIMNSGDDLFYRANCVISFMDEAVASNCACSWFHSPNVRFHWRYGLQVKTLAVMDYADDLFFVRIPIIYDMAEAAAGVTVCSWFHSSNVRLHWC